MTFIACPKCGNHNGNIRVAALVVYEVETEDCRLGSYEDPNIEDQCETWCVDCGYKSTMQHFDHEAKPETGSPCPGCRGLGWVSDSEGFCLDCPTCQATGKLTITPVAEEKV
jgi:hypothetical protein